MRLLQSTDTFGQRGAMPSHADRVRRNYDPDDPGPPRAETDPSKLTPRPSLDEREGRASLNEEGMGSVRRKACRRRQPACADWRPSLLTEPCTPLPTKRSLASTASARQSGTTGLPPLARPEPHRVPAGPARKYRRPSSYQAAVFTRSVTSMIPELSSSTLKGVAG